MAKWALPLVLATLLAGAAPPLIAQETTQTVIRPAKVVTVTQAGNLEERQYPAIVLPSQEAELSFRVAGTVIELKVGAASQLEQGDVVAELDKRDFQTTIARLESQREQQDAQLRALRTGARSEEIVALQAAVVAAEAQVAQIREQTDRTRELFERGVVSEARLEQDTAALVVAEAELRSQQEQLAIGQAGGRQEDIEAAEAALRGLEADIQKARDDLDDATLRAPFEGIVARRDIDNFTNVQAGQSIVLLQKLSTVHLAFDVPSSDVLAWNADGPEDVAITVEIVGGPAQLPAVELVEFSTQADAGTQTYRARVAVEVPEGAQILPGMVGRVYVSLRNPSGLSGLMVPLPALSGDTEGDPVVWIVDDANAVRSQPVTLGRMTPDAVIIEEGLTEGDRIVAAGVSQLREGMVIRPVDRIGN